MVELKVYEKSWPIRGSFTISRGAKTSADVIVVELRDGVHLGRGECVPYPRYGESQQSVAQLIEGIRAELEGGADREALQGLLPAGAARNAVDCALWDLEAKRAGKRAWELAGVGDLVPETTAYTLSLDSPEKMHEAARQAAAMPLLKLKLADENDLARVRAVRDGAPSSRIIVDANEGWSADLYRDLAPKFVEYGVEMIEQPLPAGEDEALADIARPLPVCADESCHDRASLAGIVGRYDMINIKLDKTGGLTEALKLREAAEQAGLSVMVGCMLGSSLAMAPALVAAKGAAVIDLDGPLLLAEDWPDGLDFTGGLIHPPKPVLWG